MADETADKLSLKSVDDLFRLLVRVRGKSPLDARDEIQDALSHDRLGINMHIVGGARRLLRAATPEELKQAAEAERKNRPWSWEFLYETLSPEGRTTPVHYNCWRHGCIFDLEIKDERLVIVPRCGLDFPWETYSFTLANWSAIAIEELWPRPPESKPEPKPPEPEPTSVVEPVNVMEPVEPKLWYAEACKANPRRANEGLSEHDRRIYGLMVEAVAAKAVTKLWSVETIGRERRRK